MRRVITFGILILIVGLAWVQTATAHSPKAPLDDNYGFLSFWNTHNGERLFGEPVTSTFEENGLIVQYFERARFEYHVDSPSTVLLGLIGRERTQWRSFPPQPASSTAALTPPESAYTLRGIFRTFWETNGGIDIFGLPISAPTWENLPTGRFQVQYFERAMFIHHPLYAGQPNEIELAPLGRELAAARGLIEGSADTNPVMFSFDPVPPAPVVAAPPQPVAEPVAVADTTTSKPAAKPQAQPKPAEAAPAPLPAKPRPSGNKRIEVDLSRQWLYAYENGEEVFNAPVATGKDGFNTPAGTFSIYAKTPLQTMRGSINGETWVVPNVPHAMYFNGSVALHGTYWHNLFGSGVRISHGCVNLPLDAAAWLYGWANVGTTVEVHY
jgi:lipoprotein-anchoring transpeptidase ErfK/SrfK